VHRNDSPLIARCPVGSPITCQAWWKNRVENEHAWKIDFKEPKQSAVEQATPHWEAAPQAKDQADANAKAAKDLADRIQGLQQSPGPLATRLGSRN
jgi:hypothetical protein